MAEKEFDGDRCMVLPSGYLQSAEAAVDIYEDDLAEVANNFEVENLEKRPGFFKGVFGAVLLWAAPSIWTVCI